MLIHHVEQHADGEELVIVEAGNTAGSDEADPRGESLGRRAAALAARRSVSAWSPTPPARA